MKNSLIDRLFHVFLIDGLSTSQTHVTSRQEIEKFKFISLINIATKTLSEPLPKNIQRTCLYFNCNRQPVFFIF